MLFLLVKIWFPSILYFFFFNDTATTEIYTLSLHDALPICDAVEPDLHGPFARVGLLVVQRNALVGRVFGGGVDARAAGGLDRAARRGCKFVLEQRVAKGRGEALEGLHIGHAKAAQRSEERRVGKECRS